MKGSETVKEGATAKTVPSSPGLSPTAGGSKQKKADYEGKAVVMSSAMSGNEKISNQLSSVDTNLLHVESNMNSKVNRNYNESPPRSPFSSPSRSRNNKTNNTVFISSTANLMNLLNGGGLGGAIANKLLESTVHYQPERDAIHLRYFKAKDLHCGTFRSKLFNFFELSFTDEEFDFFTTLFDAESVGKIDGFEFMILYIKLTSIRKNREAIKQREGQEHLTKLRESDEERKRNEAEKKMTISADYSFNNGIRLTALRKLAAAAKQYDPTDTLCLQSNLDGYAGVILNAGKKTFSK